MLPKCNKASGGHCILFGWKQFVWQQQKSLADDIADTEFECIAWDTKAVCHVLMVSSVLTSCKAAHTTALWLGRLQHETSAWTISQQQVSSSCPASEGCLALTECKQYKAVLMWHYIGHITCLQMQGLHSQLQKTKLSYECTMHAAIMLGCPPSEAVPVCLLT